MNLRLIKKYVKIRAYMWTICAILLAPTIISGQSNFVDLTFNSSDVTSNNLKGFDGCSNIQYHIQEDDKIIVACETSNNASYNNIKLTSNVFRIMPDGLLDTTFQSDTQIKFIDYVGVQSDGKIIIKGNLINEYSVIRLNPNGSIDNSYTIKEDIDPFEIIKIYPDNKLLVCQREFSGSSIQTKLNRLKTDGLLDSTFNNSLCLNGECTFIKVFNNGKILIGGDFTICGGFARRFIALINPNGTVDESFNIGVGFNKSPSKIISLDDGSILAYGEFTSFNEHILHNSNHQYLIRLNNKGEFDQEFNLQNSLQNKVNLLFPVKNNQFLLGSGKINYNVVPVSFECKIEQFNADGSKVNSFNDITFMLSQYSTEKFPYHIDEQSKGRLFIGSNIYKSNGEIDYSFNPKTGFGTGEPPTTMEIDSNGKIIIAYGSSYFGEPINHLIRILPNGQKDTSFRINESIPFVIKSICMKPDGKILIGGSEYIGYGNYEAGLLRLNNDGSIDNSFLPVVDNYYQVKLIKTYENDKLIVVFNSGIIKRLNNDGSFDDSFMQRNMKVTDIFIQPDGKILAAGALYGNNNSIIGNIIRINTNGSIDYSYASIGSLVPESMRILDNDKIIGLENNSLKVCLLSHSGNLLTDFESKLLVENADINAIGLQNKILLTGNFNAKEHEWEGNYYKQKIVLLDENGTIDTSYTFNYGNYSGYISGLKKQPDNRIIMIGQFDSIDNIVRNKIARIYIGFLVNSISDKILPQNFNIYPNPSSGYIYIESLDKIDGSIKIYDYLGKKIIEKETDGVNQHSINLSNYPDGIYFINIKSKKGSLTKKIILK
jgi:uncharacterized delta-60 repeat protein